MRLLLDTHALLWWLDGDRRLSLKARRAIANQSNTILVSAASAWEIATKARLGKLPGATDVAADVAACVAGQGFLPLDITMLHAQKAGDCLANTETRSTECSSRRAKWRTSRSLATTRPSTTSTSADSGSSRATLRAKDYTRHLPSSPSSVERFLIVCSLNASAVVGLFLSLTQSREGAELSGADPDSLPFNRRSEDQKVRIEMSVWPPDLLIFCEDISARCGHRLREPRRAQSDCGTCDLLSHCFSRRLCDSASNYTDQKNAIVSQRVEVVSSHLHPQFRTSQPSSVPQ